MKTNVLICSAGRRVSLVSYFQKECRQALGKSSEVFTTDLEPSKSAACQVSDKAFKMGRFTDPSYVPHLLEICIANDIGMVVPTIDTELMLLAENTGMFLDQGIKVVVSSPSLVSVCRDKRKTNAFFERLGFRIPKAISLEDPHYPFFVKPIDGSSSKNIFVVEDEDHVAPFFMDPDRFMHLEYLDPNDFDEYTVDLFFDQQSRLICAVPRLRIEVRGGEISKGITVKNVVYAYVQEKFSSLEGARGCITLQLFHRWVDDEFYGIEINPRFGGGYPLSYLAGANYPRMLINEYFLGQDLKFFDDWEENLLLLRHDNELIVHAPKP